MPQQPVSASRRVRDAVRQNIISATLRPGELLLESTLANEYGVSKTPAREALQMLAMENLVTVIPHRGYYVSTVDFRDFRDAMQMRLILEPALAAQAAKHTNAALISTMRGALEREFAADAALGDRLEGATAFHLACADASGNSLAPPTISTFFTAVQRLHYLHADVATHITSTAEQEAHAAIVEAIASGDEEAARTAMHDHLVESIDAMMHAFI